MLSSSQKKAIQDLIRNVGDQCIFPYFRNLSDEDISFKESEYDPVSIADQEAEKLLRQGLTSILPDSLFIGEESYAEDASILEFLNRSDLPIWIVDPIDGTANFVSGKEGFGIIISLIYSGEVVSNWFYEVTSKEMISYHKGEVIRQGDADLTLPARTTSPYKGQLGFKLFQFDDVQKIVSNLDTLIVDQATDPSIINYRKMLAGELDFLVYKMTYPWDHLAGINMVQAQGGLARRWNGEAFQLADIHEGLVVARDQQVMDVVMRDIVTPVMRSDEVMGMRSFKV